MALIDIPIFLVGFGAGGALIWFYKSRVQAAVVTVNADVKTAKADVAAVTTEIKKL
jgi:hypothetical protein